MEDEAQEIGYDSFPSRDYAEKLLSLIEEAPYPATALRTVVEKAGVKLSPSDLDVVEPLLEEWDTQGITPTLTSLIGRLERLNVSEDVFYEKLTAYLLDDVIFESRDDRAAALVMLLLFKRLPYRQLKLPDLDDDECAVLCRRLDDKVKEAYSLTLRSYMTRQDRAAALLDLVESLEAPDERVVLLSVIIEFLGDSWED